MRVKHILILVLICMPLSHCGSDDDQLGANSMGDQSDCDTKRMTYSEFVDAGMIGENAQKIRSFLGDPEIIRKTTKGESWHYGPDIDVMISGAPGSIVGLTVSFDSNSKVANVSPSRKTQDIKINE